MFYNPYILEGKIKKKKNYRQLYFICTNGSVERKGLAWRKKNWNKRQTEWKAIQKRCT